MCPIITLKSLPLHPITNHGCCCPFTSMQLTVYIINEILSRCRAAYETFHLFYRRLRLHHLDGRPLQRLYQNLVFFFSQLQFSFLQNFFSTSVSLIALTTIRIVRLVYHVALRSWLVFLPIECRSLQTDISRSSKPHFLFDWNQSGQLSIDF